MNFEGLYELNPEKIYSAISKYKTEHKINRMQGYRFKEVGNGFELVGWQYTLIKFFTFKIKTNIILKVITDKNLIIKDIVLHEKFSGSQGKKCRYDILSNHIKDTFLEENLFSRNIKIRNSKTCRCRHVYELLYGMSNLAEICLNKKLKDWFYFEKAHIDLNLRNKFTLNTYINFNNDVHFFKADLSNLNKVKFDKKYNIVSSHPLKIKTIFDKRILHSKNITSKNTEEFYQEFISVLYSSWIKINSKLNLDNTYGFTILLPTSIYSFLIQIITVYRKIYNIKALKKCLNNLQIINGVPQCLGFEKTK